MQKEKVYQMSVAKVYPLLVNKAVRKGRTKEDVDEIIRWLTGYSQQELEHEKRREIKGVSCGIRVEEIQEPLMQEIRYLDKLIDELARGKAMDKILRK